MSKITEQLEERVASLEAELSQLQLQLWTVFEDIGFGPHYFRAKPKQNVRTETVARVATPTEAEKWATMLQEAQARHERDERRREQRDKNEQAAAAFKVEEAERQRQESEARRAAFRVLHPPVVEEEPPKNEEEPTEEVEVGKMTAKDWNFQTPAGNDGTVNH